MFRLLGISRRAAVPGDVDSVKRGLSPGGFDHREENYVKNYGEKSCKYYRDGGSINCSAR